MGPYTGPTCIRAQWGPIRPYKCPYRAQCRALSAGLFSLCGPPYFPTALFSFCGSLQGPLGPYLFRWPEINVPAVELSSKRWPVYLKCAFLLSTATGWNMSGGRREEWGSPHIDFPNSFRMFLTFSGYAQHLHDFSSIFRVLQTFSELSQYTQDFHNIFIFLPTSVVS